MKTDGIISQQTMMIYAFLAWYSAMWALTSANSASMVSRSLGTTLSAWGNNSKYISYVMLNADGSFSKNAMSFLEPAHLSSTSALTAAAAALIAPSAAPDVRDVLGVVP